MNELTKRMLLKDFELFHFGCDDPGLLGDPISDIQEMKERIQIRRQLQASQALSPRDSLKGLNHKKKKDLKSSGRGLKSPSVQLSAQEAQSKVEAEIVPNHYLNKPVIFENFTEEIEETDQDGSIHYLYGENFERIVEKPERKKNVWQTMLDGKKGNAILNVMKHHLD